MAVLHYAHDGDFGPRPPGQEAQSHGIAFLEEAFHEGLVHHRYLRAGQRIAFRKLAPRNQRHSHFAQEAWSHFVVPCVGIVLFVFGALNGDVGAPVAPRDQRHQCCRDAIRPRNGRHLTLDPFEQRARLIGFVSIQRGRHRKADHVLRLHPQVHVHQVYQAFQEQPGRNQEHRRHHHLRANQHLSHSCRSRGPGTLARLVLQRDRGRPSRRFPRRVQPEHQARRRREPEPEQQHGPLQLRLQEVDRCFARQFREQQLQCDHGEPQARDSARHGQQKSFHQHLSHQLAAPGPHRRPDGHLATALRRPRQQQVRRVCHRDQQHQQRGGHQDDQRYPGLVPHGALPMAAILQGQARFEETVDLLPVVELRHPGLLLEQSSVNAIQRGLCLCPRKALLGPPDQVQPVIAPPVRSVPVWRQQRFEDQRNIDVGLIPQRRACEALGRHPDDGEHPSVHADRLV